MDSDKKKLKLLKKLSKSNIEPSARAAAPSSTSRYNVGAAAPPSTSRYNVGAAAPRHNIEVEAPENVEAYDDFVSKKIKNYDKKTPIKKYVLSCLPKESEIYTIVQNMEDFYLTALVGEFKQSTTGESFEDFVLREEPSVDEVVEETNKDDEEWDVDFTPEDEDGVEEIECDEIEIDEKIPHRRKPRCSKEVKQMRLDQKTNAPFPLINAMKKLNLSPQTKVSEPKFIKYPQTVDKQIDEDYRFAIEEIIKTDITNSIREGTKLSEAIWFAAERVDRDYDSILQKIITPIYINNNYRFALEKFISKNIVAGIKDRTKLIAAVWYVVDKINTNESKHETFNSIIRRLFEDEFINEEYRSALSQLIAETVVGRIKEGSRLGQAIRFVVDEMNYTDKLGAFNFILNKIETHVISPYKHARRY